MYIIHVHYIFGSLATVFFEARYSGRGSCDFPTKNLQTKIWNEHFYHEKWIPLPPKKNAGPTKKFVVVKKCRSVVSAMKAFGTRTAQVTGMGCVKIDLGNGNFTTQREESGRCFNHIF